MRVAEIFTPQPVCVRSQASIDEALRLMTVHGYRHYPVVERELVVGLLCDESFGLSGKPTSRKARNDPGKKASRSATKAPGGLVRGPLLVRDVMRLPPISIGPEETCALAAWRMLETESGALCVTEEGRLLGIVTSTNLLRAYATSVKNGSVAVGPGGDEPSVSQCMVPIRRHLTPEDTVRRAMKRCSRLTVRHLPVVADGQVVGTFSTQEILRRTPVNGRARSILAGPVSEVMSERVLRVPAGALLSRAASAMVRTHQSALPVEDGSRIVGIITQAAALKRCATTARLSLAGFPG